MRKAILVLVILLPIACLFFLLIHRHHGITVRTYFGNAMGLRPGAHVRMDGVDIGLVREIRVGSGLPGQPDRPVEVTMLVGAPGPPIIPNDATASLRTEGVLGPTFVDIDTRKASGPPIGDNGVLKGVEANIGLGNNGAAQLFEVIGNAMLEQAKKLREQDQQKTPPTVGRP